MCEICQKTFCPVGCPNRPEPRCPRCPRCGAPLSSDEGIKAPDGELYCNDCISEMDIDEVLGICELPDIVSLFNALTEKIKTEESSSAKK